MAEWLEIPIEEARRIAAQPTPKVEEGEWMLISPSGKVYEGESPLRCVTDEVNARVDPWVALARIRVGMEDDAPPMEEAETFVRDLLWNEQPECCGRPVVGAEYMGSVEHICCGCPEGALLNEKQIVASLRERFPEKP